MIIRLNREKKLLVVSVLILIGALLWNSLKPKPVVQDDVAVQGRAKGYFSSELKTTGVSRNYNTIQAGRPSPFKVSSSKEDVKIDLPLPEIIIKSPVLTVLAPLPGPPYDTDKFFRLSAAISKAAGLVMPDTAKLPKMETLEEIFGNIAPIEEELPPKIDPDYREDDVLVLGSGEKVYGRIVKQTKDTVIFTPRNFKQSIEYNRADIRDVKPYQTIREQYQEQVKNTPDSNADGQWRLALWCFEKNMDVEAVKALQNAINAANAEIKYYLRLAEYYAAQMDTDKELSVYQQGLKSLAVNKEIFYERLGDLSERMGLQIEALAHYETAIKIHPHYVPAWLKLGDLQLARGDYEQAGSCYQRVQEISPNEPVLPQKIGILEFRRNNLNKAKELLEKQVVSANILGIIAVLSSDYVSAVKYFEDSIRNSLEDRALALTNLAYLYMVSGNSKEAELLFSEAAKQDPASVAPIIGLGYLKWMNKDTEGALSQFNLAIKTMPSDFFAYYSRGQLYFYIRNDEMARKDFTYCLESNPSFPGTLYYLASISYEEKRFMDAVDYYRIYIKNNPVPMAQDQANLGIAYAASGQFDKAVSVLNQALAIKQDYIPALSALAYIEFANNNAKKAIEILEEALKLDSEDDYSKRIYNMIKRASTLVIWIDDFKRPDGTNIGRGWTENEKYGIEVSIAGQRCVFSGKQSVTDKGITSLEMLKNRVAFVRIEVEFESQKDKSEKVIGFYIADQTKRGMLFIANVNNKLCYGISRKADTPPVEWKALKDTQMVTNSYKIALEKIMTMVGRREVEEFECSYNNESVDIIPAKDLDFLRSNNQSLVIGVFGYSPLNKKWEFAARNINMFETKAK
ncbi:MAG: tetratricopeptide repeat protein [Candidatus Brocadiia bacterium]